MGDNLANGAQLATAVDALIAGRRRKLQLRIGEIGELERLTGAGIGAIFARLATVQWTSRDVREAVRLGLEGGGASPAEADALVMRYLDPGPLAPWAQLAADVVRAAVTGIDEVDEAEPGKPTGASDGPATSPPSGAPPAP